MHDVYQSAFDPREYLRAYYSGSVSDDERAIFDAAVRWVAGGRTFDRCLEVGCGPTVHHVVPFVPAVGEFHLSDYLPANLGEVRKWLDGATDAHDWSPHIREALESEGSEATPEAVAARAAELRRKVTALKACDICRPDPLGDGATYDLVTSFYTAECAVTTKGVWREVMRNLLSLVRPGGAVFMASMLNCERYDVLGRWFETASVSADDVVTALAEHGFPRAGVTVEAVRTQDMPDHGFAGIYIVSATKGAA